MALHPGSLINMATGCLLTLKIFGYSLINTIPNRSWKQLTQISLFQIGDFGALDPEVQQMVADGDIDMDDTTGL